MTRVLGWRCFPWVPEAGPGEEGAPDWLAPAQTTGRFDLHNQPPVLYLGESAAHAVAEVLQGFRGSRFSVAMLKRRGRPLAVACFCGTSPPVQEIADLTDPSVLLALGVRPDAVASHRREVTQRIARQVHATGAPGLRWWSSLTGHWHTTVLFADRWGRGRLAVEPSRILTPEDPAVREAREFLRLTT